MVAACRVKPMSVAHSGPGILAPGRATRSDSHCRRSGPAGGGRHLCWHGLVFGVFIAKQHELIRAVFDDAAAGDSSDAPTRARACLLHPSRSVAAHIRDPIGAGSARLRPLPHMSAESRTRGCLAPRIPSDAATHVLARSDTASTESFLVRTFFLVLAPRAPPRGAGGISSCARE